MGFGSIASYAGQSLGRFRSNGALRDAGKRLRNADQVPLAAVAHVVDAGVARHDEPLAVWTGGDRVGRHGREREACAIGVPHAPSRVGHIVLDGPVAAWAHGGRGYHWVLRVEAVNESRAAGSWKHRYEAWRLSRAVNWGI